MARIAGDTEDLPRGWRVDADNWGMRPTSPGDIERLAQIHTHGHRLYSTATSQRGVTYVMRAETARFMDGQG